MNWREQLEVSHRVLRDTDDVLVLRHHWQGAVALGLLLAVLGSPAIVATLSDGSERKIMTAVRPDSLSHVADRIARLTGTRKL